MSAYTDLDHIKRYRDSARTSRDKVVEKLTEHFGDASKAESAIARMIDIKTQQIYGSNGSPNDTEIEKTR